MTNIVKYQLTCLEMPFIHGDDGRGDDVRGDSGVCSDGSDVHDDNGGDHGSDDDHDGGSHGDGDSDDRGDNNDDHGDNASCRL